jgi:hypothetical protein
MKNIQSLSRICEEFSFFKGASDIPSVLENNVRGILLSMKQTTSQVRSVLLLFVHFLYTLRSFVPSDAVVLNLF